MEMRQFNWSLCYLHNKPNNNEWGLIINRVLNFIILISRLQIAIIAVHLFGQSISLSQRGWDFRSFACQNKVGLLSLSFTNYMLAVGRSTRSNATETELWYLSWAVMRKCGRSSRRTVSFDYKSNHQFPGFIGVWLRLKEKKTSISPNRCVINGLIKNNNKL